MSPFNNSFRCVERRLSNVLDLFTKERRIHPQYEITRPMPENLVKSKLTLDDSALDLVKLLMIFQITKLWFKTPVNILSKMYYSHRV